MGDTNDEAFNARLFSRDVNAVCLNVECRLVPEYAWATGHNDCWDMARWAATSAKSVPGCDLSKGFILGGSSVGGNFAAALLAHLARNTGLSPPVTGQWLFVPYLIPGSRVPGRNKAEFVSYTTSKNDLVIGRFDATDPDRSVVERLTGDLDSPLLSVVSSVNYPPMKENQEGKAPLARAFLQVAALDPLRDHALVYERILREEYGVKTRMDVYAGFGHAVWTNWPEMETSGKFARDMVEGMRWLIEGNGV